MGLGYIWSLGMGNGEWDKSLMDGLYIGEMFANGCE